MQKTNKYRTTKLYSVWSSIIQRCNNKSDPGYKHYGARGIKICEEWINSITFCEWAFNNGYEEGLEIDRKNNNGNYEPLNCRFVTHADNNGPGRRRNNKVSASGYIGVYYVKSKLKYRASIMINGKHIFLGYYKNAEDALKARIKKEIELFGEQRTNLK